MAFLKNKKFQMGALCALLVAVIAVGAWWFLRPQEDSAEHPGTVDAELSEDAPGEDTSATFLSNLKPRPYSIIREDEQEADLTCYGIVGEIFYYDGQVCCFEAADAESIEVVSMLTGEVLRTYTPEDFLNQDMGFTSLYMDYEGTLWALYELDHDPANIQIIPCKEGVSEADVLTFDLSEEVDEPSSPTTFAVWENYVVIHSGTYMDDKYYYSNQMLVINTDSGEVEIKFNGIWRFCLDMSGNLYYLTFGNEYYQNGVLHTSDEDSYLAKYSLKDAEQLWSRVQWDLPVNYPDALSYSPEGGLFLAGENPGRGLIYWIDPNKGALSKELTTLSIDVDDFPEELISALYRGKFAVDEQYRVYIVGCDIVLDDGELASPLRRRFVLEPTVTEVAPEDMTTLTVTAPYRVDAVSGAVKLYQRSHPEVNVVWDTAYVSEEEFNKNAQEYKDQFALRAMAGDLGDIVMLGGLNMSLDTVTGTDAFADLSGYLEQSSVKEELLWNLIEAMRGEDGAIRGIPVGIVPNYFIWNEDLLQEYGIDPDTATWSQLLDLALQWQAYEVNLSLATTDPPARSYMEAVILRNILLANLQNAGQKLDTPELREVLTKLKELKGSQQLVRGSGMNGSKDALFAVMEQVWAGSVYRIKRLAEEGEFMPFAGPLPLGETTEERQGYAYCWGIGAKSQQKDAAWDFLQFLVSSTGLPQSTYADNAFSVNTAAQEIWGGTWAKYQNWGDVGYKFFHQIQEVLTVPYARFDEPYGWVDAIYNPVYRYYNDELTLDEALQEAEASWERYLKE